MILDVGANLGAYSIPIAKKIITTGGKVIAFEPQRIVYYQLCGNIILNRLDNYFAFNQAVGDSDGFIEIPDINYEDNHNIGAFSVSKEFRERIGMEKYMKVGSNKVQIIKLDDLTVEKPPALVKIDVEGYELNVLKGGANFFEQNKFPPILFECWNYDWFSQHKTDLFEYVKKLGYEVFSINENHIAQHPENAVHVDFISSASEGIKMIRTR